MEVDTQSNMIGGSWSVIHGAIWEHDLLGSHFTVDLLRFGYTSPTSQNQPATLEMLHTDVLGHVPLPPPKKLPIIFVLQKSGRSLPVRSGIRRIMPLPTLGSLVGKPNGGDVGMLGELGRWNWNFVCWFTLKKISWQEFLP